MVFDQSESPLNQYYKQLDNNYTVNIAETNIEY